MHAAVQGVAHDRMADGAEVDPNLVGAPCVDRYLCESQEPDSRTPS